MTSDNYRAKELRERAQRHQTIELVNGDEVAVCVVTARDLEWLLSERERLLSKVEEMEYRLRGWQE